ncbi:unnamed protein product [Prorocentrum cordatum]|uniref:Uncharacterized protein n=1 Tax=Prorocentrum cordatum TaxID=2364126 RepID=A0ABN9SPS2_9DINO|nr:unnamed protein product [Polarella glacialis]
MFESFQAWPKRSPKVCSVCWINRQGLESNLHVSRRLSVMQAKFPDTWKLAAFSQGSRVPFPKPMSHGEAHAQPEELPRRCRRAAKLRRVPNSTTWVCPDGGG